MLTTSPGYDTMEAPTVQADSTSETTPETTPKRAAVYVRVSSDGQEDNASLDTQAAACRRFAEERGFAVVAVYRDVWAGAEYRFRPQLTAMRESIRGGELDAVIAYAVDRLSRDSTHLGVLYDEAAHHGAAMLFVTEDFDTSPSGKLLRDVRAYAAAIEREKIQERTSRGKADRLSKGKLPGSGFAPLGYKWADKERTRYVIDEDTAPVVRRIFDAIDQGQSLRQLGRDLDAEGIPTPRRKPHWTHASLRSILENRSYIGEAIANKERHGRVSGKHVFTPRPEEETTRLPDGLIPPLISRDQFERVQRVLEYNAKHSRRTTAFPDAFLLRAGFVVCGYCGEAVHTRVHHNKGRRKSPYLFYTTTGENGPKGHCGRKFSIMAPTLDAAVWSRVEVLRDRPEAVLDELGQLARNEGAGKPDLKAVDQRIAKVTKAQENAARAVLMLDNDDAAAPVVAKLKALAAELQQLQADRADIASARDEWEARQGHLRELMAWIERTRRKVEVFATPILTPEEVAGMRAAGLTLSDDDAAFLTTQMGGPPGDVDLALLRTAQRAAKLEREEHPPSYQQKREWLAALGIKVRLYDRERTPRYEIDAAITLDGVVTDSPTGRN